MTNTIPNVPRELLERVLYLMDNYIGTTHPEEDEIRAILSAPSPAGVDADHVEDVRVMVVPSIAAAYAIGAKGGSVVDAERLAFESWMAGHCWALCAAWDGAGYRCESEQAGQFSPAAGMTRRLWAAWRDRAALSAVCAAAPNIATTSEHSSQPERDPCPMCIKGGICNTPTCGRLLAMPKAY